MLCASTLLGLSGACAHHAATEIVLRVDSDLGSDLLGVRVTLDRGSAASTFHNVPYSLAPGHFALPGTIGIAPATATDGRPLHVVVSTQLADPAGDFSVSSLVAFQADHTLELDVFLSRECRAAAVRGACESRGQTCGRGGNCVPVARTMLSEFRDAGVDSSGGVDAHATEGAAFDGGVPGVDVPGTACGDLSCPAGWRCDMCPSASGVVANCHSPGCGGGCPTAAQVTCTDPATTNCEGSCVNLGVDPASCGRCGNACVAPNAHARCERASCVITGCVAGFGDCNATETDGCEVPLTTTTDCGACGRVCLDQPGCTLSCASGDCVYSNCPTDGGPG